MRKEARLHRTRHHGGRELRAATVIVRRNVREKLGCEDCEGAIVRAPVGDKVVTGGRLGPRLVAELLVDKYSDGLPLHRRKERFARMGLDLPVSTLTDQVTWATDLLRPVWRAGIAEVLASKVMHLDATGLPVLDREVAGGKRLGALWGYVGVGGANIAAYVYTLDGLGEGAAQRRDRAGGDRAGGHARAPLGAIPWRTRRISSMRASAS
jgi:transposase